jgi:hypothetical protein
MSSVGLIWPNGLKGKSIQNVLGVTVGILQGVKQLLLQLFGQLEVLNVLLGVKPGDLGPEFRLFFVIIVWR